MSIRHRRPVRTFILLLLPFVTLFAVGCRPVQVWHRFRAHELIKEAQGQLREGNSNESVRLFKQAENIDPDNPQVWGNLCSAYSILGELDLAIAACKRQVASHPSGLDYNSLGLAYLEKKDYPDAIPTFEAAVKYPDSLASAIYPNLISTLQSTGQYDKAILAAERAVEASGQNPIELTESLDNLAGALALAKQDDRAIQVAERAVEVGSQNPAVLRQALNTLIGALEITQQYERAIPSAERLVEVSAKDSTPVGSALETLIWVEFSAGHYERAVAAAQRLVEASAAVPTDLGMAYDILGAMYMKNGQADRAQETYAKEPRAKSNQTTKSCEIKSTGPGNFSVSCQYSK